METDPGYNLNVEIVLVIRSIGVLTGWEIGDQTQGQESGKYQRGESM